MKVVPLGEVASLDRRAVNPTQLHPDTPYLGLEHIENGGRITGYSSIARDGLRSTKFQFDQDHLLFGKLRPNLGKIALPNITGICSTDILPIRTGPRLDRGYLAHFLRQPAMVIFATSRTSGVNLPRLSPSALEAFPVPLPHIHEQRRIAAILDQADALRTSRRRSLGNLDALRTSIFHDMFSTAEARVSLGEVITHGPTNGLYRPASDYGSGTPILRIDGFDKGVIHSNEWKRVRLSEADVARYSLSAGDIIINRVNALSHLGKSALVRSVAQPSVFESNMMRLRLDEGRILPEFVIAWLQTSSAKHQILSKAKKAINQASINQADLRSLLLPLPPRAEQEEFNTMLSRVAQRMTVADRSLAALDELFASLQYRAFQGDL